MNALVVYTHPTRDSLNGAILEQVVRGLKENPGISDYRISDLYAEGFDPILRFGNGRRRRDMAADPEFASRREDLEWADVLVFIYPIWWGRPPAMLLGFFDQVMARDFAYRYTGRFDRPEGLLKGKKALCIYTTRAPRFYNRIFLRNSHQVNMRRAVLRFIGLSKVSFLEFGSMESRNERRVKALERTRRRVRRLAA